MILVLALAVPYVLLNLRRLMMGRPWAFSVCHAAKEWEARERARHEAARRAPPPSLTGPVVHRRPRPEPR